MNGYDPNYKAKVKLVVETIEEQFEKRKQFSAVELNRYVGIDSNRYLRLLGRLGFLQQGKDKVEAKTTVYNRTSSWPPPVEFFKGTPIGIVYYLQKWFLPFGSKCNSAVKYGRSLSPRFTSAFL